MRRTLATRTLTQMAAVTLTLLLAAAQAGADTHTATVLGVGDTFGNLDTDLAADTLALPQGAGFQVTCGDRTFDATWTVWYSEVPQGDWLGLPNGEGNVQIAINGGDADSASGCGVGDVLILSTSPAP